MHLNIKFNVQIQCFCNNIIKQLHLPKTVDRMKVNRLGGEVVSVLTSSGVYGRLDRLTGQAKDNKISICYFYAWHAALKSTSKDWLVLSQDNRYEVSNMSAWPMDSCFSD